MSEACEQEYCKYFNKKTNRCVYEEQGMEICCYLDSKSQRIVEYRGLIVELEKLLDEVKKSDA